MVIVSVSWLRTAPTLNKNLSHDSLFFCDFISSFIYSGSFFSCSFSAVRYLFSYIFLSLLVRSPVCGHRRRNKGIANIAQNIYNNIRAAGTYYGPCDYVLLLPATTYYCSLVGIINIKKEHIAFGAEHRLIASCPCTECETIKVKAITLRTTCHYYMRWTKKTCVQNRCMFQLHKYSWRWEKRRKIVSNKERKKASREWKGAPKSESFAIENNNIRSWMRTSYEMRKHCHWWSRNASECVAWRPANIRIRLFVWTLNK